MANNLTPILAISNAGLLSGQGLAMSGNLLAAINTFNSSSFTRLCSTTLGIAGSNVMVRTSLKSITPCLTGMVPDTLVNTVPADISPSFYFNNLVTDVGIQANLPLTHGVPGLLEALTSVNSTCTTSFELLGSFDQMKNVNYSDFGFTMNNYKDITTGGVNSQFNSIPGGIASPEYKALANQFGNFGTMFDATNLGKLDDPRTLCQSLLDNGYMLIDEILTAASINVADLANADQAAVLRTLATVKGLELEAIVSVTKFVSYKPLESLADVLDATKILSPAAATAAGGSLTNLSRKLTNIGGTFNSFAEVKNLYSSIADANTPTLGTQSTIGPNHLFASAIPLLGEGTGTFNNPTMFDLLGAVTGYGYIDDINTMSGIQTQIMANPLGQQLYTAMESLKNNPTSISAMGQVTTAANNLTASATMQPLLATGQENFVRIFTRLLKERTNLKTLKLDLSSYIGSTQSTMAFVSLLHSISEDPMKLNYADVIKKLVTSDTYGESILAAIAEGQNISLLNGKGIPSYTKLNPLAHAKQVLSQLNC